MNERIKELMVELKKTVSTHRGAEVLIGYDEIEKFAELIVKECIAICTDIDGEDNTDARSGRQDCAVEIKEHFGVEV